MNDELLLAYLPWLRKVAGGMLGFSSPDLDDLVQEGYIEMWKAGTRHDPSLGPLDYWLKFKASHRMKTVVTRRDLRVMDSTDDLDLAAPDMLSALDMAYHHGEIAEAINSLPPAQRKYVVARFWQGLRGTEMHAAFGYDPSSLWNNKDHGAKQKLAHELAHLK